MKELFGGSTTEQKAQSTSTPVDVTPPELKALRAPFVSAVTNLLQQGGTPAYPGQLSVDANPAGAATATANLGASANNPLRGSLLDYTMAGGYLPGQAGANPFLEEAIKAAQRPTLQGLEETLSRTLPGRFTQGGQLINRSGMTGVGGGSSAFDRAAALASTGAANALKDIATNMSFQGYESERGRQQQAIQLSQNEINGLVESLKAEWMPTAIQQWNVETGLKEFQSRMTSLLQALGIAAGSPISQVAQQAQSTSTGTTDTQQGIIPGIAQVLGAAKGTPMLPAAKL